MLIQFLRQNSILILSLFKNYLGPLSALYQVQEVAKTKNWLEFLIIWTSSSFLWIWCLIITFLKLSLMSISGCLFFIFHFRKTFLTTETFCWFLYLIVTTFSIWWTYILILLSQLWSILRILKSIFEIFWLWLGILILETICGTCFILTICLIAMISLL